MAQVAAEEEEALSTEHPLVFICCMCGYVCVYNTYSPPVYCVSQSVELFATQDVDLLIWMLNFDNTDYNWTLVFIC